MTLLISFIIGKSDRRKTKEIKRHKTKIGIDKPKKRSKSRERDKRERERHNYTNREGEKKRKRDDGNEKPKIFQVTLSAVFWNNNKDIRELIPDGICAVSLLDDWGLQHTRRNVVVVMGDIVKKDNITWQFKEV